MTLRALYKRLPTWALLTNVALIVFAADYATKQVAIGALKGEPPITLLPFLRLIYVENTGVAFGLFAGGGAMGRAALVIVALTLCAALFYYAMRLAQTTQERWACALFIGGAAGNITDRIRHGAVIDFIDAHIGEHHWPAFNIADAAITIGALLFAWSIFKTGEAKKP